MDETQLRNLAAQLARPTGEGAETIAAAMNEVNNTMTARTIETLAPQTGETIAEIGDSEITGYDYRRQIQRDMQILGRRIGRVLTPEQAQAFGLYEAALSGTLARS